MDPLQQLRDVHVPVTPGWWPPAPGWWLLAIALMVLAVYLLRKALRRRTRRRPFKDARLELAALSAACGAGALAPVEFADACNGLLKRLHIHALGHVELAGLSGDEWLEIVDAQLAGSEFQQTAQETIGASRFRADFAVDPDTLTGLTAHVIERFEAAA